MANLWNFAQFQVGWFALVLSAAAGAPLWGYLTIFLLVSIHLVIDRQPLAEVTLLLVLGFAGWCWESLVQSIGWLSFAGESGGPGVDGLRLAPPWMAALWVNFATTLNHSLAWLQGNGWLAAFCGAVGGPLAFVAGDRLGAVDLQQIPEVLFLLVAGWSVLTPAAVKLASRLRSTGNSPDRQVRPAGACK